MWCGMNKYSIFLSIKEKETKENIQRRQWDIDTYRTGNKTETTNGRLN